jgi:EpsI family protein
MDRARAHVTLAISLATLAAAGNALRASAPHPAPPLGLSSVALEAPAPPVEDGWMERDFLDALGAREVLHRTYGSEGGAPVWMFLGYFDRQKEGSQVHSPRHCYPGSGWNIEAEPDWAAPWGGKVRSLVVSDGTERRLVCYWFQTDSRVVADVLPLKLELARRAVARAPQDVVFASLSTPILSRPEEAAERLAPLARRVHAELERLYRERHESHARGQ